MLLFYPIRITIVPAGPKGATTICPNCGSQAIAMIPAQTKLVDDRERSDGTVRVNCMECTERFRAYFREKGENR